MADPEIAVFLKKMREEHGLTQQELADLLGVKKPAVSQWENGGTGIKLENLYELSRLYSVSLDSIFLGGEPDEFSEENWDQKYGIDPKDTVEAIKSNDVEKVKTYYEKIGSIESRFFYLLYKKMSGKLVEKEEEEYGYLKQFYDYAPYASSCFFNKGYPRTENEIANVLFKEIGRKKKAITWELYKMYKLKAELNLGDEIIQSNNISSFFFMFRTWRQVDKDVCLMRLISKKKNSELDITLVEEMISAGARPLFDKSDYPCYYFSKKDYDFFSGEKKALINADKALMIRSKKFAENDDTLDRLTYDEYHQIVDKDRLKSLQNIVKNRSSKPIEYWKKYKGGENDGQRS